MTVERAKLHFFTEGQGKLSGADGLRIVSMAFYFQGSPSVTKWREEMMLENTHPFKK